MRSRRRGERATRHRAGFSIVEVLVALVLVTVGLLGVAGNCALGVRVAGSAARERRAAQRGADRIALLSSRGCSSASSGAVAGSADGYSERWAVNAEQAGVVLVEAEVRWPTPNGSGSRSVVVRDALLC